VQITDEKRQMVDGAALTSEIGIDQEEIQWRKEYTNFTDDALLNAFALCELYR
jgi:heme-based aerotactic transducer